MYLIKKLMSGRPKKIFAVSRLGFLAVFLVTAIGFVGWEIHSLIEISLRKGEPLKQVQAKEAEGGLAITEGGQLQAADQVETSLVEGDSRPEKIRRYLEKYKSPLVPYADLIFKLSETYGFEYYWIVAIGQQESNLCKKIPVDSHNCWGYGIHSKGTLRFENYELALRSYAEYLKREYFDEGLNTPELIMSKYCPNSNGSWARGVRQFINELENGKI
jgi:hypothetical protein